MRLIVIQEMLRSIDTLTLAGQRHEIGKIVGLLEEEILGRAREAKGEGISALLPRLQCEAGRLLPNVQTFTKTAALVVDAIQELR